MPLEQKAITDALSVIGRSACGLASIALVVFQYHTTVAAQPATGAGANHGTPQAAQATPAASAARNLLDQKLRLVERLLGAKEREKRVDASVSRAIEQARGAAAAAKVSLEADDTTQAAVLLDDALRTLSRASGPTKTALAAQHQVRYQALDKTVRAFRNALARLIDERGVDAVGVDLAVADASINDAGARARLGAFGAASAELSMVYDRLSRALTLARKHETIEYRLEFKGAKDEYLYERDRYKSNRMLIRLMVSERRPPPAVVQEVLATVEAALALDARAQQQAVAGDFEKALETEESAVRHLNEALRHVGVYIPR